MRIRIDLEANDPPQGLIGCDDDEPTLRFAGWLGLVASLERLLAPVTESVNERDAEERSGDEDGDDHPEQS